MNVDLSVGRSVRIERSSGEIQTAWICSVEPDDSQNVVLQWEDEEHGATVTKQKEVHVSQIVDLNPDVLVPPPNFEVEESGELSTTAASPEDYTEHKHVVNNIVQVEPVSSVGVINMKIDVDPDSTVNETDGGSGGYPDQFQVNEDSQDFYESYSTYIEDGSTPIHGTHGEKVSSSSTTFRARKYSVYQQEMLSGNANWDERVAMMQRELHDLKKKQVEDVGNINKRLNSIEEKQSKSMTEAEAAFGAFQEMTVRQGKMEELLLKPVDRTFFRQKISEMEQEIDGLKAIPAAAGRPRTAERIIVKCSFCDGNFCKSYISAHKRKHCKMNPDRILAGVCSSSSSS